MIRVTRISAGILLSGLMLWFLFRGTNWYELKTALISIDIGWMLLAFLFSFSSLFARVQRWSYVVRATHPAKFSSLFSATQIGMLANALIPARVGDVIRGYVLAMLEKLSFTKSMTLVALDRINDIFALVVVLLIAALSFPSNTDIEFGVGAFGNPEPFVVSSSLIQPVAFSLTVVVLIVLLILVTLYFKQDTVICVLNRFLEPVSPKANLWITELFLNFAAGMHVFRSAGEMLKSVLLSLITWALVALSLASLMMAFHIEFPWFGPILMLAMLGVFTSVTVTPGLVGQYHVPVVASLLMILPAMNVNEAKAFAIIAHLVALLPPVVLGVYCMMSEKLHLQDLVPSQLGRDK